MNQYGCTVIGRVPVEGGRVGVDTWPHGIDLHMVAIEDEVAYGGILTPDQARDLAALLIRAADGN